MKYLHVLCIIILILSGCSGDSLADNYDLSGISGLKGDEVQEQILDFISNTEDLTLTLTNLETGYSKSYPYEMSDEGLIRLFSSAWDSSCDSDVEAQYSIRIAKAECCEFELFSDGVQISYTNNRDEKLFYEGMNSYDTLRFNFDTLEASPANVSIPSQQNTIQEAGEAWTEAYRQHLLGCMSGGANEMDDVKIIFVEATSTEISNHFQLLYRLAVKPSNYVGNRWGAGGGYDGDGNLEGYIIASNYIILEQINDEWHFSSVVEN